MCEKQQHDTILTAIARYASETLGDALDAVILCGSYARGDYDAESDIDVMVFVDVGAKALRWHESQCRYLIRELWLEDGDCTMVSPLLQDKATFDKWLHGLPFHPPTPRMPLTPAPRGEGVGLAPPPTPSHPFRCEMPLSCRVRLSRRFRRSHAVKGLRCEL